jgi:hypothetical protein
MTKNDVEIRNELSPFVQGLNIQTIAKNDVQLLHKKEAQLDELPLLLNLFY